MFQSVVSDQKEESRTTDVICEEVEWYPSDLYFTHMGAMYSFLLALDRDGKLHRWSWDSEPVHSDQVSLCYACLDYLIDMLVSLYLYKVQLKNGVLRTEYFKLFNIVS